MAAQFSSDPEYQPTSPFLSGVSDVPALVAALQKLLCEAVELLELEDCALALLDKQGTSLLILTTAQEDSGSGLPEHTLFSLCESPLARLLTERVPLLLPDAGFDTHLQPLGDGASRALACLPLLEQDRLSGVLIASGVTSASLDTRQMRMLALLASHAALLMSNARHAELVRAGERAKASFLSLVTHELRSPLNSLNGYLDLTLDGLAGELNEQQQEFLRRARASSEYLYALLEDLLLAARADAGQLRLKRDPIVFADLVGEALEGLELAVRDAGVILEIRIPAEFPKFFADAVRLQQVVRNLLGNAVRFTPAGGSIILTARVLPRQSEGGKELVEISVRDTGYGISPEYHERIFERFFQLPHIGGGRISGQGLGLAVVRMIVELHGGRVRVESVPDAGSTFIFTLDVHQDI
jgi:signal transduction histidine kinase